jgi:hypothetical protein
VAAGLRARRFANEGPIVTSNPDSSATREPQPLETYRARLAGSHKLAHLTIEIGPGRNPAQG